MVKEIKEYVNSIDKGQEDTLDNDTKNKLGDIQGRLQTIDKDQKQALQTNNQIRFKKVQAEKEKVEKVEKVEKKSEKIEKRVS